MSTLRELRLPGFLIGIACIVALLGAGTRAVFTDSQANSNPVGTDGLSKHFEVAPGSAVRPNTTTKVASGDVDSLALDFGTAATGQTFTDVFTVKNVAGASRTAQLSTANLPAQVGSAVFASTGTSTATLAPGATASVTVTASSTTGSGSGSLKLGLAGQSFPTRTYPVAIQSVAAGNPPSAPSSVSLTNGQGVGNAYVNDANKGSLNANVTLPASSTAGDTVRVTISDGTNTTAERTATAAGGTQTVSVTGIDATSLADGSVTIRATASNASGTSTAATAPVTKDTVKPSSGLNAISNITSGNSFTVPYTSSDNSPSSTLQKVEIYVDSPSAGTNFVLGATDTTPTASENISYTGATTDGTYGFYALAYDKAGNVETTKTSAERTATRITAPLIDRAVIAKSEDRPNSTAGYIRPSGTYFVYANVTPVPGSAITTVNANLSALSLSSTSVALAACTVNCVVNGESYSHVTTTARTALSSLTVGAKGFAITATDNASRTTTRGDATPTSALTVTVDNVRPVITSVATSGDDDGIPEQGETFTFGYDSEIDGTSLLTSWVWPFTTANVRVSFTHRGANNDLVTLQGGTGFLTAVNLGTIDLGSANYVTGVKNNDAVFFGGTGAAQNSTIQRSGNTIVVTLGSPNGGDVGAAVPGTASSNITWTASAGTAYDVAGNLVATSPANVQTGTAAQF